ncbi:hypothetical protein AURDEDRAFT_116568 [Auricularia subglabra TFB-10046 SS5]|nr:hypothetical protein AURDEDRAFT_116568 [Auricularia subglabra TFB-10046 SS5]
MAVTAGVLLGILVVVSSPAVRSVGKAALDLCARVREALCPSAPARDVEQGADN